MLTMENGQSNHNNTWLWLGAGLVLGLGVFAYLKRSHTDEDVDALDKLSDICDALSSSLERKIGSANSRLAS